MPNGWFATITSGPVDLDPHARVREDLLEKLDRARVDALRDRGVLGDRPVDAGDPGDDRDKLRKERPAEAGRDEPDGVVERLADRGRGTFDRFGRAAGIHERSILPGPVGMATDRSGFRSVRRGRR
jgi:hypothetical protein